MLYILKQEKSNRFQRKMSFLFVILASLLIAANAQLGSYAGGRGSDYKDRFLTRTSAPGNLLVNNRDDVAQKTIGNSVAFGTAKNDLPYDAYIVGHRNALPIEQRPHWILNQQQFGNLRGTPSRWTPTTPPQQTAINNQNIVTRIADSTLNGNRDAVSQQEVVYPSNISSEQRLTMEIQYSQERLARLLEQSRQLQARNGQQAAVNTQRTQSQWNF